jgi:hypothetical protein
MIPNRQRGASLDSDYRLCKGAPASAALPVFAAPAARAGGGAVLGEAARHRNAASTAVLLQKSSTCAAPIAFATIRQRNSRPGRKNRNRVGLSP